MSAWSVDYVNNPYDDYNLVIEVLHNDEDVAFISQGNNGLEIKWYPTEKELIVPIDWLVDVFSEAKQRLGRE